MRAVKLVFAVLSLALTYFCAGSEETGTCQVSLSCPTGDHCGVESDENLEANSFSVPIAWTIKLPH